MFLVLVYTINKVIDNDCNKVFIILLFIISPAYLWEIYVKSDLMSNVIMILCFMLLWNHKYKKKYFLNPFLLGISTSFIFLTRVISAIPLIIFLYQSFKKESFNIKIKYIVTVLSCSFIFIFWVLKDCPDIYTFLLFNPIQLQFKSSTLLLSIVFLIWTFFISLKSDSFKTKLEFSGLLLFLITFIPFLRLLLNFNFSYLIYDNLFDISYFNFSLPFVIICIFINKFSLYGKS